MCGHVGVFGKITKKERTAMKHMLLFDTVRGEHSTGLLTVNPDGKTNLMKALGTPDKLYEEYKDDFEGGVYKTNPLLMMGHNRYATQGGISVDTAHPFEFRSLIGAHNGTVNKFSMKDFHESDKYDVDSQMIFSEIDNEGHADTVFLKADGAMALVWWDKELQELNFARNTERTLYKCHSKDEKTLFWASETWMLHVALSRAGIDYHPPIMVKELENQVITLGDKGDIDTRIFTLPKKEPTIYPKLTPVPVNTVGKNKRLEINEFVRGNGEEWEGGFFGTTDTGEDIRINTIGYKQKEHYKAIQDNAENGVIVYRYNPNVVYGTEGNKSIHFVCLEAVPLDKVEDKRDKELHNKSIPGFQGELISLDEYKKTMDAGCAWCASDIKENEVDQTEWVGKFDVYCKHCKTDPNARLYIPSMNKRIN